MPIFQVLRRVDAFIDYVTEVEADDAAQAAVRASADETRFAWCERSVEQFDARVFVALDDQGAEIDGTQQGDF